MSLDGCQDAHLRLNNEYTHRRLCGDFSWFVVVWKKKSNWERGYLFSATAACGIEREKVV
jgi:hypothetical protein